LHNLDLSVVIITLNEENSLRRLLHSLPKGCEVVVLDSGSTDKTVTIAQEYGARVEVKKFDGYAMQKNVACALASKTWVLSLDADEELSPELSEQIQRTIADSKFDGYRINRRLHFMGRRMKYGKTSDNPLRLFKRTSGKFTSEIHESVSIIGGNVGDLSQYIEHYSYKDITDYFMRFNNYTSRIAANHHSNNKRPPSILAHVMRPWMEFFYRYVIRGGFLDGYPGYCYALFSSTYTFVKYAKYNELLLETDKN